MNDLYGLIIIFIFGLLSIAASVRHILIGKNIINNPMYDNEAKKKYILRLGIICIIPLTIFVIFIFIIIIILYGNQ